MVASTPTQLPPPLPTETVHGTMAIIVDRPITRISDKLRLIPPDAPEYVHMLAAYCFDHARKMTLLYLATRGYGPQADPTIAGRARRQSDSINEANIPWQERARRAHDAMLELAREVDDEYDQLLSRF